jgi:hypothetical protein
MLALTRPGGVLVVQEPDATSWNGFPPQPAWERLKGAILAAFARGEGDFNAGRRTYGMWRQAGLEEVQVRAAAMALPPGHPYRRLPIQFATSLRRRILEGQLLTEAALDDAMAACEQMATDANTFSMTSILSQVWGRKSGH